MKRMVQVLLVAALLLTMVTTGPPAGASAIVTSGIKVFPAEGDMWRATEGFECYSGNHGVVGPDTWPTVSPDGGSIAFSRPGAPACFSNKDIFVVASDGGEVAPLVATDAIEDYPAWSPLGDQIAFALHDGHDFDIWLVGADGSNPHRLLDTDQDEIEPSWSPDGKQLAVTIRGETPTIAVLDLSGDSLWTASKRAGLSSPDWSPDGNSLALVLHRRHGRTAQGAVLDISTGIVKVLPGEEEAVHGISWSPDGRRLAVGSCGPSFGGACRIATTNLASGVHRIIGPGAMPDWTCCLG